MEKIFYWHPFLFDRLSLFFVGVIALIAVPAAVYSIGYMKKEASGKGALLAGVLFAFFVSSMCMVVIAGNLFSFLVFWEIMSLVSYFLVVFDHTHEKTVQAGVIYLVMTHVGTAFIIAAFLILYSHAHSFDFTAIKAAAPAMPVLMKNAVFLLLLAGFSTKAGVVPLHIWLPYAHPQAPSHISTVMSGVMIKTAIYGMIRFFICLLGGGPSWWGALILVLAVVSCLTGIIYTLMEHDLKRLLAYSSVENIGIILLGVGAAMFFQSYAIAPLMLLGICAGLYHLINHALFKGLLFLCSGSVVSAVGTRDMEKMGGLIKVMPWTGAFFLIGAMGISALPPLNGFVSEWLMLQTFFAGMVQSDGWIKIFMVICASALALTSGLAAASFVKAFGITFLAMPRSRRAQDAKEAPLSMKAGMAILAGLVVLFGLGAGLIAPVIFKVGQEVFNVQAAPFHFRWFALSVVSGQNASISPSIFLLILAVVCLGVFAWLKLIRRARVRSYNTWDCGYYKLDSRTEYTATAFSKPFRIAFSFFLLPYRKSEKIRDSFYHVRSFTYETHTTPIFKRYLYNPMVRFVYTLALKLRRLQPGSINLYISYIFFAVFTLIIFLLVFKI